MVKKAAELKDFDRFNFSMPTRHHVASIGDDKKVIKIARDYSFEKDHGYSITQKWLEEVAWALNQAGYIRHDLNEQSFRVGKLYKRVYQEAGRQEDGLYTCYQELITNEDYEAFQSIGRRKVAEITGCIEDAIGSVNYDFVGVDILKERFGLGTEPLTYRELSGRYELSVAEVKYVVEHGILLLANIELPSLAS